jgi:hypothetical protein
VFATGIGANDTTASCDNETLGQTSGTANVEIDWQPNTINITWYNDDTQLTVQSSAQSCVYDDDLYLPSTQPTKTGYTFKGWTIQPRYDFVELGNLFDGGGSSWSIDKPLSVSPYHPDNNCMYTNGMTNRQYRDCSISIYNDLQVGKWKAVDGYGATIYGEGKCSAKSGDNNNDTWNNASSNWLATREQLDNVNGEKRYCWCRLTGYKPNGVDTIYGSSNTMPWIFETDRSSVNSCEVVCAMFCSAKFISYSGLRNALFGITQ